jgi:hypothetical protein
VTVARTFKANVAEAKGLRLVPSGELVSDLGLVGIQCPFSKAKTRKKIGHTTNSWIMASRNFGV